MAIDDNLKGWIAEQLAYAGDGGFDPQRLSDRPADRFDRRVVVLEPAESLDHLEPLWHDSIVFVVGGEIAVECTKGDQHPFREGDVLTLARLPVVRVRNSGATPTRLLVIRRKTSAASRNPSSEEQRRTR